jgi:hypothetical protein
MRKLDPCENGWDIKLVLAMELIPVMMSIRAGNLAHLAVAGLDWERAGTT